MDERPPRAVEHEDPLARDPSDLACRVALRHVPSRGRKRRESECRGSLGVCSTGRQAAFKALRFQLSTGYPPCPVARWRLLVSVAVAAARRGRDGLAARTGHLGGVLRPLMPLQPQRSGRSDCLPAAAGALARPRVHRQRLDERLLDAGLARRPRTTCSDPDDLSAYWAPTLYVAGKPVHAARRHDLLPSADNGAGASVPRGLEMVAGNSHAVTGQSPGVTQWYCGVLKSAFYGPLRRTTESTAGAPELQRADEPRAAGELPGLLERQRDERRPPKPHGLLRGPAAARRRIRSRFRRSRSSCATRRSHPRTSSSPRAASSRVTPTSWTRGTAPPCAGSSRAASITTSAAAQPRRAR